jgi:hypothetical protein
VDVEDIADRTAQLESIHGGPRVRAVIIDSTKWPEAWRAAADTVGPPPVTFGTDALILVATRGYPMGRIALTVKWIRRCRRTGVIVVATLQTSPHLIATAHPSRGMSLVRVPRRALDGATVAFRDLPSK